MSRFKTFVANNPVVPSIDGTEILYIEKNGENYKAPVGIVSAPAITRAQIPTTTITSPIVVLSGFSTAGDLGAGATYTSVGATQFGIMAIQDAAGTWFQMLLNNGPVNLGWFGLVGDGITDNLTALQTIQMQSPRFNKSQPQILTITINSPAVFTLNNHGFKDGTPVVFSTTGQLPTGLVAGQPYWVIFAGLTVNTFQVSASDPFIVGRDGGGPDGPAVDTSGTQSGVHSVAVYGQDWVHVFLPPGHYTTTGGAINCVNANGNQRVIFESYGATTTDFFWLSPNIGNMVTSGTNDGNAAKIKTQGTSGNTASVTLVTLADTAKFYVGEWAIIMALDLQGPQSFPPNYHYFEYKQISNINAGTGVITFTETCRNPYKSTYPFYGPIILGPGPNQSLPNYGAGFITGLNSYWDVETHLKGLHIIEPFQNFSAGKILRISDSFFESQGHIPSFNKIYIAERCRFTQGIEIDKLNELVIYRDCTGPGTSIQSSSTDRIVYENCDFNTIGGTTRLTEIRNCSIGQLTVGPIAFGVSESVLIENSRVMLFQKTNTFYDDPTLSGQFNLIENFTWSGGTFSKPITDGPIPWAVPGSKVFVRPFGPATGMNDNIGSPFVITDVRTDGSNTLVDTTLTGKPVGNSTNSAVTITIGNPTVINWTSHGLSANTPVTFLTTGALPTGMPANIYYVLAAGLTGSSFEFSTSPGGSPVATSGTQSGTQTAIANPLQFISHPCPRLTIRGCTGSPTIAAMSDGPPELPIYSYFKRLYTGDSGSISGAGPLNVVQPYAWGKLISLSINVIKAYTGATNPLTLTITANGWTDALAAGNLTQVIDMRTTGLRTITQTTATGSVGADTIAAFANWISGAFKMVFNSDVANDTTAPLFEIEVFTDQGVTKYNMVQYFDNNVGAPALLADTDTNAT